MDFHVRDIDFEKDKDFVLDCHCKINFACEAEALKKEGYIKYSEKWLSTKQPEEFYSCLLQSRKDNRSIIVICETDNVRIGYIWVSFSDVEDYDLTIAEIEDIYIDDNWRKKGYASRLLSYAEEKSKESGAKVLRSGTGFENTASKNLHIKADFIPHRIEYEKILK